MSKEQLLAAILELPTEDQRALVGEVIDQFADIENDPDMTPELRAELERRYQDILANPDNGKSWEEVSAELDKQKSDRPKNVGQ